MRLTAFACVCLALTLTSTATAQRYGLGDGAFAGMGTVEITRPAERMRMHVDLLARGKTVKEALDRLKERKETATAGVQKLGAIKDSVKIDDPRVQNDDADQSQMQMRRMMMARAKGKSAKPGKTAAPPVTVKCVMTAEWKLEGKDLSETLVASHELKEKIEKADLSGANEVSKLTPEEQEMLEEMQAEGMYGNGNEKKPGTPLFLYVATIGEKERDQALADAFKKAQAQAGRLAKAAGLELGPLSSLSSNGSQGGLDEYANRGYYNDPELYQTIQALRQNDSDDQNEAMGSQPGKVTFRISVSAGFGLKTP